MDTYCGATKVEDMLRTVNTFIYPSKKTILFKDYYTDSNSLSFNFFNPQVVLDNKYIVKGYVDSLNNKDFILGVGIENEDIITVHYPVKIADITKNSIIATNYSPFTPKTVNELHFFKIIDIAYMYTDYVFNGVGSVEINCIRLSVK